MSATLKIGDYVTVVGMIDRQLHRCVVQETRDYEFRAQAVGSDYTYSRNDNEEGTLWARGWGTADVKVLHALVALENSR